MSSEGNRLRICLLCAGRDLARLLVLCDIIGDLTDRRIGALAHRFGRFIDYIEEIHVISQINGILLVSFHHIGIYSVFIGAFLFLLFRLRLVHRDINADVIPFTLNINRDIYFTVTALLRTLVLLLCSCTGGLHGRLSFTSFGLLRMRLTAFRYALTVTFVRLTSAAVGSRSGARHVFYTEVGYKENQRR